jgi:hypothetical protein
MIFKGIFDNSFASRVNASFQYLDSKNEGSFTLRDLFEKGEFVFKYLSILPIKHESIEEEDDNNTEKKGKEIKETNSSIEHGSDDDLLKKEDLEIDENESEKENEIEDKGKFSIIDIFRQYDINGGGTCCIVEFVVGNIESLLVLYENEAILSEIIDEIIPGGFHRRDLKEIISILSNEPISLNSDSDVVLPVSIAKSNDVKYFI